MITIKLDEDSTRIEEKETMLVGFDIHKFVTGLCNQFLDESPDMTEGEKKAYKLGINNTLSLLGQTLNDMIVDEDECYNNIAVHVPGLDFITEFATIEELIENTNIFKEK